MSLETRVEPMAQTSAHMFRSRMTVCFSSNEQRGFSSHEEELDALEAQLNEIVPQLDTDIDMQIIEHGPLPSDAE